MVWWVLDGGGEWSVKHGGKKIDSYTVFVKMFDRTNVRPFPDFSGSSSFFTVEHFFYEDGTFSSQN